MFLQQTSHRTGRGIIFHPAADVVLRRFFAAAATTSSAATGNVYDEFVVHAFRDITFSVNSCYLALHFVFVFSVTVKGE